GRLPSGRPRRSTLFPYTTLFRSGRARQVAQRATRTRTRSCTIRRAYRAALRWLAMKVLGHLTVQPRLPERIGRLDELAYDLYWRSEEHTSELQSRENLVCRLLLE